MTFEAGGDTSESHEAERRRHTRCKVTVQLELQPHGTAAPFHTSASDISLGGCYVETMFTLVVGTTVEIKLWLGAVMLCISGIVTTCHPQVGNGIQFTSINDADVTTLKQFLANQTRDETGSAS